MTELNSLQAINPLDGRYWNKLAELSPFASEMALIKARVEVELKYLIALSEVGVVRKLLDTEKKFLLDLATNLNDAQVERIKEIENVTRHDVKAIEKALRELLEPSSCADLIEMIHFGLTSEDINNLAVRLMLQRGTTAVTMPALETIVTTVITLATQCAAIPMLARTHGQPAIPTTLGKELANFANRLQRQVQKLQAVKLTGKLNGAIGNYNALVFAYPDIDWIAFSQSFITSLELEPTLFSTQINYADDMIELFQAYQRVNNVIINIDTDMWRYISDNWFVQEVKKGEVGSSTMPQKVNPIDFENSKGNAELANGLFETLSRQLAISWLQRDLSGSTVSRNIGTALGYSLLAAQSIVTGFSRVRPNETVIHEALHENWTILSEGVQTLLRKEGVADPYSLIAELSKGKNISAKDWSEWVASLDVKPEIKSKLLELTPDSYVGLAEELVERLPSYAKATEGQGS